MRVLIIHQNFPGQFRHMAAHWASQPDVDLLAIGRDTAPGMPGVRCLRYRPHRAVLENQHHYLRQMEHAVLHGQSVARLLLRLKSRGYSPDVILAHPGWGETLYAKDVFPDARLIHFCEWYYGTNQADWDFDPEFPATFDDRARVRTWNALHTLNLENCDAGITPTHWQHSRHPEAYRDKIAVIHEGIDTDGLAPSGHTTQWSDETSNTVEPLTLPNGTTLNQGDPVITYVARNLEPYRGFHSFMRALERIQKQHRRCHAIIVGGDGVSYGKRPKDATHWREMMLREVTLDPPRTHFLGKVPYDIYRRVLQISAAHVYLTYPFVLSWSMLEAMASGCLVIGSNTAPVKEVIRHQQNGLLTDFFDTEKITESVLESLATPELSRAMRQRAVTDIARRYSRETGLNAYQGLIEAPWDALSGTQRMTTQAGALLS